VAPELNLYDEEWPIWTYQLHQPPAKFVLDEDGRRGTAVNSMISGGCIISGAFVNQSLLFSAVRVDERSSIFRSVVMPNVKIGSGCTITHAILDEGCELPSGTQIGINRAADAERFYVTDNGIVLVTPDMLAKLGPKGT
jgi:glucose-1-phosphate adenylyltransferase